MSTRYYLFESLRHKTLHELVLRSSTEIETFEYKFDCKYGDYANIVRLTEIHPTVKTTPGSLWKIGHKYILCTQAEIIKILGDYIELTGDKLQVSGVQMREVTNADELTSFRTAIADKVRAQKDIEAMVTDLRQQLYWLEGDYETATEGVTSAITQLQKWGLPQ